MPSISGAPLHTSAPSSVYSTHNAFLSKHLNDSSSSVPISKHPEFTLQHRKENKINHFMKNKQNKLNKINK
jgi:hypothetical protein